MPTNDRIAPPARRPRVLLNALALHDSSDAARTFLENLVTRLPEAWPEADLYVVMRRGSSLSSAPGVRPVEIRSPGGGVARVAEDMLRLPAIAEHVDADVVISPNESIPTRLRRPVVVVAQNLLYHCREIGPIDTGSAAARLRSRLQFAFYRRQMPRAYARADLVVTVSQHAADELARAAGLEPSRVRVVPYGADRLPVLPRSASTGRKTLLVVGSLAHYKRLDVAVRALAELVRAGGDYELVLAGGAWPGYGEALDRLAGELGVSDRVRRLGGVDGESLAALFAGSHALLALSACESFGIPVVEGMRAGLPAVVADEPWSAETVGDAAVRVAGAEPAAVAAGVHMLADDVEWQRHAERGKSAASRYTWARNAAGIADAASSLVA